MAAAFVWAQASKMDFADSVRWAIAEGTATAADIPDPTSPPRLGRKAGRGKKQLVQR